jgi:type IV pilus assembly protein PilV
MLKNRRHTTRGFSLIEVLVALVILSVGLLGVGALILNSVKANDSSSMRSQAAVLANSIVDNMRANKAAAIAGNYTTSFSSATPTAPTGTGTGTPCSSGCSSSVFASLDVYNWLTALASKLPSGEGSIAITSSGNGPGGDLTTVTITVIWDDSRAISTFGANSSGGSSGGSSSGSSGGSTIGASITCPTAVPNCAFVVLETIL